MDDYVRETFFLKEATQRIKRVIDRLALEKMAKAAPQTAFCAEASRR